MITLYECEGCGKRSKDRAVIEACEAQPTRDFDQSNFTIPIGFPKVGDVVACAYPASERWEGDPEWAVEKKLGGRFLDGFYGLWVVVDRFVQDHKWKYILWTPSNEVGRQDIAWTSPDHTPCHVERKATDNEMLAASTAVSRVERRRIRLL